MAIRHGDVIFTGDDPTEDRKVQRDAAAGKLRRIAAGIYAPDNGRLLEEIVCGSWAPILAHYAPGSILHGRSGLMRAPLRERGDDGRPVFPGWIFAIDSASSARKQITLPGLEIRIFPGHGPLEGDIPFLGVYLPSDARALLENLVPSRSRLGPSRTSGRQAVEVEIDRKLSALHEDGLRDLRAKASSLAPTLGLGKEFEELANIIGAVLGTREAKLHSPDVAARRRQIDPYDPECLKRLLLLEAKLRDFPDAPRRDPHTGANERMCVSFVEAYFTNYIEGTKFLVEKARRIVFEAEVPDGRARDGRDVTQTFMQIVELAKGMSRATTSAELIDEIRERNRVLLDARPEKRPGQFKEEPNRAGNTVFVMPNLVVGTLREGFAMLKEIERPFDRAVFMHALLVMTHPFDDGNGRTARIMMTKEFVTGGCCRAIVPTIFRPDYIGSLRALTHPSTPNADPFVRVMARCQDVTSKIVSGNLDEIISLWASTHAFLEDEHGAQFTDPNANIKIVSRNGIPAPADYWSDIDAAAEDNAANPLFRGPSPFD